MPVINLEKILIDKNARSNASKAEVLELIERFPYNLNLLYLLLEKIDLKDQIEKDFYVKKLSAFSIDRRFLKNTIRALEGKEESITFPVKSVKKRIKKIKSTREPKISQTVRLVEPEQTLTETVKKEQEVELPVMSKKNKKKEKKAKKPKDQGTADNFESWLAGLQSSIKSKESQESKKKKGKKKKKKKKKDLKLARMSLSENEDVISETLADLLANQGYKDKACEMYSKLILLFPEKSTYFAGKIENLKKL